MTDFNKPTNPQAFPYFGHTGWSHGEGMTLRDYMAAKTLQGMFANPNYSINEWSKRDIAIQSYAMADEMLKARER
jgi:hypothetical protein